MCRHLCYWHFCTHLVHKYEICPSRNSPNHQLSPPSTILDTSSICHLCYEPPENHTLDALRARQLTINHLADILSLDINQLPPDIGDRLAWFFARGDHLRFSQPAVVGLGIEYADVDPVMRGIDRDDWGVVYTSSSSSTMQGGRRGRGRRRRRDSNTGYPGYAFDVALTEIAQLENAARPLMLPPLPRDEDTPEVPDVRFHTPRPRVYQSELASTTQNTTTNANHTPPLLEPGIYTPFDDTPITGHIYAGSLPLPLPQEWLQHQREQFHVNQMAMLEQQQLQQQPLPESHFFPFSLDQYVSPGVIPQEPLPSIATGHGHGNGNGSSLPIFPTPVQNQNNATNPPAQAQATPQPPAPLTSSNTNNPYLPFPTHTNSDSDNTNQPMPSTNHATNTNTNATPIAPTTSQVPNPLPLPLPLLLPPSFLHNHAPIPSSYINANVNGNHVQGTRANPIVL